jgi:hypothetical protein
MSIGVVGTLGRQKNNGSGYRDRKREREGEIYSKIYEGWQTDIERRGKGW